MAPPTPDASIAPRPAAGLSADVAQLVEQLIRNQQVTGSNPVVGSTTSPQVLPGSGPGTRSATPSAAPSWSMNPTWPVRIRSPRLWNPEPGGAIDLGKFSGLPGLRRPLHREHAAAQLRRIEVSLDHPGKDQLPARLPQGCRARNPPVIANPVSSASSRLAASKGSSPSLNSPFGIDHAPRSFFAQSGPPGWTRNTSSTSPRRR